MLASKMELNHSLCGAELDKLCLETKQLTLSIMKLSIKTLIFMLIIYLNPNARRIFKLI